MRIRPVLVWLDCSCVWDTCRGGCLLWWLRSADGALLMVTANQPRAAPRPQSATPVPTAIEYNQTSSLTI